MGQSLMEHYTNSCDACGDIMHDKPSPFPFFNGLSFDISGGYDQFTDLTEGALTLTLCHDCVLRMIALFPAMGKKLGKGCHPCESDTPCCAFAWQKIDGVGMVPSKDLQSWVPFVN
jgi:hypothetical protein